MLKINTIILSCRN